MRLKKICWRNFKSYSNIIETIDFEDKSSLNLIVGSNGTGKSSIAEVITYTLYGKIENFKASEIPNRINKNFWAKIELDCDGHFVEITRGLAPSIFKVSIDGEEVDTAGKSNVQTMLEEVYFKVPYSVFINTLVLSINDFKSLIDLNASDKRNIIDKIFGFTVYNKLTKIAKDELKSISSSISSNAGSINTSSLHISNYSRQIEEIKGSISSEDEINGLLEKINKARELKETNEKLIEKLSKAKEKFNSSTLENTLSYKENLNRYNEIKKRIELIDLGKCPKCGSSLAGESFEKEKKELEIEAELCLSNMSKIKESLLEIKSKLNVVESKENEINRVIRNSNLVDLQSEYKYRSSVKESNLDPLIEMKKELDDELKSLNEEKTLLEKNRKAVEAIIQILGDNGIKKYIASKYVPVINKIILDVLQYMGLPYIVKFDDNFNGTITEYGYNVNYSTLSTGEKKRIDFACVISIIKFLKIQLGELNLLFLDELFSNIDTNGVSDMIELMRNICGELEINIYLIHHAQLEGVSFDNIIYTKKPDGFSRIEIKKGGN